MITYYRLLALLTIVVLYYFLYGEMLERGYYFAELLTKVLLKRLDSFRASFYDSSLHIHWFASQSVIVGHGDLIRTDRSS